MVYILLMLAVACVIAFIAVSRYQTQQPVLFGVLVVAYAASMGFFLLYLCKDSIHLGIFLNYFPFPRNIVLWLYTLQIPKETILRLLNFSCITFLFSNVLFSTSFLPRRWWLVRRIIAAALGVFFLAQLVLYDPYIYKSLYSWLYPQFFSAASIEHWYRGFEAVTRVANSLLLGLCIVAVVPGVVNIPRTRLFRLNLAAVVLSYALLIVSYLMFFSRLPSLLVRYSKVANLVTFRSLAPVGSMVYYQYFPYAVLFLLLLLGASFFAFSSARHKADAQNQDVTRNIRAANVSSRLFCHYMKNEILAISAEVEELAEGSAGHAAVEGVLARCETIYSKLDGIHKSMRDNVMNIHRAPVDEPVQAAIETAHGMKRLEGVQVQLRCGTPPPYAAMDPVFLEQAVLEFVLNAGDAMENCEPKTLQIKITGGMRWVSIEIADTGCGITPENITNIFTPLYTSKPISKNWGIGLTMAHKIVTGLGGRVNVRSTPGAGTSFEILLPAARPPKQKSQTPKG